MKEKLIIRVVQFRDDKVESIVEKTISVSPDFKLPRLLDSAQRAAANAVEIIYEKKDEPSSD